MGDDPITIEVWSDIACPWCYIGKRRLAAGIAAARERGLTTPVMVRSRSFQLDPDGPDRFEGTEAEYLVRHKGLSPEDVAGMLDRVAGIAREEGLEYDFAAVRHANTLGAHRLLHHALAAGLQSEVEERLMRAYFVEGRDLGDDEVLADIAAEAGLDREEALVTLVTGGHTDEVRADQDLAVRLGIRGVPFVVLDGRYGLSGAQPADVVVAALEQVAGAREGGEG